MGTSFFIVISST